MAQKKTVSFTSIFFLQLALGVFFLMLGIMGLGNYNSDLSKVARWFGRDDTLRVIMAVVELVMGGILLFGLFIPVAATSRGSSPSPSSSSGPSIIFMTYFINGNFLEPSAVVWLYGMARDCGHPRRPLGGRQEVHGLTCLDPGSGTGPPLPFPWSRSIGLSIRLSCNDMKRAAHAGRPFRCRDAKAVRAFSLRGA